MSLTELWLNYIECENDEERVINYFLYKLAGGTRKCQAVDTEKFNQGDLNKCIRVYCRLISWLFIYVHEQGGVDYILQGMTYELNKLATVTKTTIMLLDKAEIEVGKIKFQLNRDADWLEQFTETYTQLCKSVGVDYNFTLIIDKMKEYELKGLN